MPILKKVQRIFYDLSCRPKWERHYTTNIMALANKIKCVNMLFEKWWREINVLAFSCLLDDKMIALPAHNHSF